MGIYLYDFQNRKKETILDFTSKDGIISHCKLVGVKGCLKMLYVKDTTKLMLCDLATKKHTLLGVTKDAVLCLHVAPKRLRKRDLPFQQQDQIDLEDHGQTEYLISCADDSEAIYFFDTSKVDSKGKPVLY